MCKGSVKKLGEIVEFSVNGVDLLEFCGKNSPVKREKPFPKISKFKDMKRNNTFNAFFDQITQEIIVNSGKKVGFECVLPDFKNIIWPAIEKASLLSGMNENEILHRLMWYKEPVETVNAALKAIECICWDNEFKDIEPTLHIFSSKEAADKFAESKIRPKFDIICIDEEVGLISDIEEKEVIIHKGACPGPTIIEGAVAESFYNMKLGLPYEPKQERIEDNSGIPSDVLEKYRNSRSLSAGVQELHENKIAHLRKMFKDIDKSHFAGLTKERVHSAKKFKVPIVIGAKRKMLAICGSPGVLNLSLDSVGGNIKYINEEKIAELNVHLGAAAVSGADGLRALSSAFCRIEQSSSPVVKKNKHHFMNKNVKYNAFGKQKRRF